MNNTQKEQYIAIQMDYYNLSRQEAEVLAETLEHERFSQSFIMDRDELIATAQATVDVNNFLDIATGAVDTNGKEYNEEELVDLYNTGVVSKSPEDMIREDRGRDVTIIAEQEVDVL